MADPHRQQPPPQLNVLAQYIKDFSFENPNAPRSLQPSQHQPAINIQINVGSANNLAETDVEVALKLEGKAENSGSLLFSFDLTFAGVFRIQNVPQESLHPLVMIECPRLLFPFAREIVATAVRNGGFPPLLLDPVDFVGALPAAPGGDAAAGGVDPGLTRSPRFSADRVRVERGRRLGQVAQPDRIGAESGDEAAMRLALGIGQPRRRAAPGARAAPRCRRPRG